MSARRRAGAPLAAYVLHRWDWSESSLVLDLFTRELGRVAVAAKGAKRPYSQLRVVLLPLQRVAVVLGRAGDAGEVHTLRSAEWAGGSVMPTGEPLLAGFHLNEIVLRLLAREDPHPVVFDAYAATLPWLVDAGAAQAALRAFELVLLREIGWLPDLAAVTIGGQALRADARYALRVEGGLAAAAQGEPALPGGQWLRLQAALDHGGLEPLRLACAQAGAALRPQLRALLHYHAGGPLRTRGLMLELQRLAAPAQPR